MQERPVQRDCKVNQVLLGKLVLVAKLEQLGCKVLKDLLEILAVQVQQDARVPVDLLVVQVELVQLALQVSQEVPASLEQAEQLDLQEGLVQLVQ